ncbi:PEP-CTERM sorting domain-containing protein [Croceibacterium aestuarii]|uniref:PEP-CTERM sorting domain-containing protein n=1 Tax=Croceibacterium aestuarii TaxID=3064139 RepID=UPI00272E92DD|nr:PEP-CTERM sorting domain-containing protein [Croceibacterium sp. D39]
MGLRWLLCTCLLCASDAAFAGGGAQVPEGSQFTLFALGLAGVLIGRRLSMRGPGED